MDAGSLLNASAPGWDPALDDDWLETHSGARVSRYACVASWVVLERGVVVHPFAVVGHLASQSKVLAHPGNAIRALRIGENTEIGPHAVIYGGCGIGANCLIGDGASIRENVTVGNGCIVGRHVTVNFGAWLGESVRVMDGSFVAEGCYIGPGSLLGAGVVTSGDRNPNLSDYRYKGSNAPRIGDFCLIGSGANLLPGVRIGNGAKVGAGALVVQDVPEGATVVGQPSAIRARV